MRLENLLSRIPRVFRPMSESRAAGARRKVGLTDAIVSQIQNAAGHDRTDLWTEILKGAAAQTVLELGVYRGHLAEALLNSCQNIRRYYMIDPWRHLDDWNKPANVDQATFDTFYAEAMRRTEFARDRRVVLRGTTNDVIEMIGDDTLDVAYIDGDHTLRGISIDLIRTYRKVRPGGILGGDDYTATIWQHSEMFEPSLVCPFAAYFAESQDAPLVVLPFNQFAIVKPVEPGRHFRVVDTTGSYGPRVLLPQIAKRK